MVAEELNAERSAEFLTEKVSKQEPFIFLRYGDGALECMAGRPGCTCDREFYTHELAQALREAWDAVIRSPRLILGDWQSASFEAHDQHARYREQYSALIGDAKPLQVHFEALLLMRDSQATVDFYRAVKSDPRRKVFMGPASNAGAAKMLGAEHLVTPMVPSDQAPQGLHRYFEAIPVKLWHRNFDVLLYGAGMAANVQAVKCWQRYPDRTYINVGSAFDVLFKGRSRRQQLTRERAWQLFADLLVD